MLWGDGHTGGQDAQRLAEFQALSYSPSYIMGFYEPDCYPPMSSDIDPSTGEFVISSQQYPPDMLSCRALGVHHCPAPDQRRLDTAQPGHVQAER